MRRGKECPTVDEEVLEDADPLRSSIVDLRRLEMARLESEFLLC
jgi:hypothetical protein